MKNSRSNANRRLADRLSAYREGTEEAAKWLERNLERLTELLKNVSLRDFIFEPIKEVFSHEGDDDATAIRQTITLVAVANAVMAGLPGKMGVGVAVSMALEGWMAYVIARPRPVGRSIQVSLRCDGNFPFLQVDGRYSWLDRGSRNALIAD